MGSESYDFIVVGGGPAGCTLATSLAKSAKRPSVLLIEAGARNDDKLLKISGKRWATFTEEGLNYGYKTTPQEHCGNRQIDYSRGKCLGGSSAINFGVYAVGARDDYDQWAAELGDDTFAWKNMQLRFRALETFSAGKNPQRQQYGQPDATDHGDKGALKLEYVTEWEADLTRALDAFKEAGLPQNQDHNSGNPIGMGLTINSTHNGVRTTAVDLINTAPDNLVIVADSPVRRVLLEGKKAVGVEAKGKQCNTKWIANLILDLARNDVILSAGSLDTPKILMHSGIGPANELEKFQLPVVQDLPAIGQGLRDHPFLTLMVTRKPETNDRNSFFQNEEAKAAAIKQWEADGSGPWARYGCQLGSGWFKSDRITSSAEFQALPADVQEFLNRETIPHYEMITHFPVHMLMPQLFQDYSYICLAVFLMNGQTAGEVRLQSSNPEDPLLFDPHFLEHPFDRRVCIEMYRHLMELVEHPAFAKDTISMVMAPKSKSDEDILQFARDNLSSSWHMTGTVKMGKPGDASAAVDNCFRVFGIDNLRVADMSVLPVLTNNHTQATAYVTGATCADVLIREYGLDG
ncbi:hypothetical protein N7462_001239 [Penicillium macrosclerotiorum]|uniref:uncharacterized protein n=1 Tax=Penicillium macrosclerotiorum TaxID=303699 RepID=UPI002548DB7C|nr:uncharacterized protein N7462_001239 [Penicillium macrosclerotiorum]KAJ5691816.1 hypothetical protein N7462_001239 [Penicillium macrosclerotiorum]